MINLLFFVFAFLTTKLGNGAFEYHKRVQRDKIMPIHTLKIMIGPLEALLVRFSQFWFLFLFVWDIFKAEITILSIKKRISKNGFSVKNIC